MLDVTAAQTAYRPDAEASTPDATPRKHPSKSLDIGTKEDYPHVVSLSDGSTMRASADRQFVELRLPLGHSETGVLLYEATEAWGRRHLRLVGGVR